MRTGKYLDEYERAIIEHELRIGTAISKIARDLGRGRATIQREIKRGKTDKFDDKTGYIVTSYDYKYGQRIAMRRQANKGSHLKIDNDFESAEILERLIKDNHWSPAAALGYATKHGLLKTVISIPTLYAYIKNGVLLVRVTDLPRKGLQNKRKQEQYQFGARKRPKGTSIEERPKEALHRKVFGHWEGDLIIGKRGTKTVYLTLVERLTRYCIAMRLPSKHANGVIRAFDTLEARYGLLFSEIFKSVTFDNGTEFLAQQELETSRYKCRQKQGKRTHIYYAHPYCSSERGSNENCNGLLRRAGFTKSGNLGTISNASAKRYIDWVNQLPRKIHNFATSEELFSQEIEKLRDDVSKSPP